MTHKTTSLVRLLFIFGVLLLVTPAASQETEEAPRETVEMPAPAWDYTHRRIDVPILMYHYVSNLPEGADDIRRGLTVSPDQFRAHMDYLFYEGYTPISLYALDDALLTGTALPPKPVVLTFDDGHIDHYVNVFPILKEYNYTGTFFIITALADMNNPLHLNWTQIREMADAGMSMENHTKNHVGLQGRDYDTLVYQMLGARESLNVYTGRESHMFAYPGGDFDALTLDVAGQMDFWRAVTTEPGTLHTTDNRLLLPRVRIPGSLSAGGLASILND